MKYNFKHYHVLNLPVITCSSGILSSFLFKRKSPKALDSARLPLTLLNSTQPPAAVILFNSASLLGLWSIDKTSTFPLMQAIARESPTLA